MSNKTSDQNVANDIKILKKFCEYEEAVVLTDNALEEVQDAINNILAERKQDKKRIQELDKVIEYCKRFEYETEPIQDDDYLTERALVCGDILELLEDK